MKYILLKLIVLCTIYKIEALLRERSESYKYDDIGKIRAHCEKHCVDSVKNFTSAAPGSHIQKIPLVDKEKYAACGKYKSIHDCEEKLNEVWVHNTIKSRLSVCKPKLYPVERRIAFCHQRSADFGLELIIRRTPNQIWERREELGEDTLEYIK